MSLRKEIEADICELFDDMDPSGKNTERFRAHVAPMSDTAFFKYIDEFFDNPDKNFPVAYEPFNNPVTLDFAHKVAKKRGIPIYERVFRPYVTGDTQDPPGTVNPIMVLDFPVKRLKQMVFSKNHTSTKATQRDAKTGQVTGHDKTARVTDVEAYSLLVQGQYSVAQESYGPMADDTEANYAMLKAIQRDGEVELADLPNDTVNKVTMNTINAFMLGSGIESNLIDESEYLLPSTIMAREDKTGVIDRSKSV